MKTLPLWVLLIIGVAFAQESTPYEKKWRMAYDKSIDILEAKYPDVLDDNSIFTRELDRRIEVAKKGDDPVIKNPDYVLLLADKLAMDLKKASIPFSEKPLPDKARESRVVPDGETSLTSSKSTPTQNTAIDVELDQWRQKYPAGFSGLSDAYPDVADKCSPFRILFSVKMKIAEERNDPRLNDSDYIHGIAKSIPVVPLRANDSAPNSTVNSSNESEKCPETSKLLHEMTKAPPFETAGRGRLAVSNGVRSHAIVKLIVGGKKAYSFYIKPADSFAVENIPDGNYRVLFAFSDDGKIRGLDNFLKSNGVSEFQDGLSFSTTVTNEGAKIITRHSSWNLTLYAVNNGNAKTKSVDESEFDKY